jgi:uncharacterized membrane protein YfcA
MRIRKFLLPIFFVLTATIFPHWFGYVSAHEFRPGFLSLTETYPHTYSVLWKVPMRGPKRLNLDPKLPGDCRSTGPVSKLEDGVASTWRWTVQCHKELAGREIAIKGLPSTFTDVLVRVVEMNGSSHSIRLTPSSPRMRLAKSAGVLSVAKSYTGLGIEHILLGADHLLFILMLFLLVKKGWVLVKTITAFTASHSITLAAATLDIMQLPSEPVEAVIALSILFLATELARRHFHPTRDKTLTERYPWSVVFVFGIIHGFGFAGALAEVGLPPHAIPLALLFFNVGVEVGQLAFIGIALGLTLLARHWYLGNIPVSAWSRLGPVYVIGGISALWFLERLNAFL